MLGSGDPRATPRMPPPPPPLGSGRVNAGDVAMCADQEYYGSVAASSARQPPGLGAMVGPGVDQSGRLKYGSQACIRMESGMVMNPRPI